MTYKYPCLNPTCVSERHATLSMKLYLKLTIYQLGEKFLRNSCKFICKFLHEIFLQAPPQIFNITCPQT